MSIDSSLLPSFLQDIFLVWDVFKVVMAQFMLNPNKLALADMQLSNNIDYYRHASSLSLSLSFSQLNTILIHRGRATFLMFSTVESNSCKRTQGEFNFFHITFNFFHTGNI